MEIFTKFMGFDLICEYLIKSTLVLGCSLFLVYVLRKKSASHRHFILAFSLISLMLLPLLSSFNAGWETKLVPARFKNGVNSDITKEWIKSNRIFHQDKNTFFFPAAKSSSPSTAENSSAENEAYFSANLFRKNNLISPIISMLWMIGLWFLLLRIIVGFIGAFKLTRNGEEITKFPLLQILQQIRKVISIKRKVQLLSNKQILVPITWGVIKPVVILPEESRKWTESQYSSVLFHELSHIKRGDFIIKLIARFSCALFWFNPLIWMTYKLMKKEQEKACDELVLNSGIKPSTYAENLLSIKQVELGNWSMPPAVLGALSKSHLNDRLVAILKRQIKPKEIKMKNKIFLSLMFILIITVIGLARPINQVKMKGTSSIANDISMSTTGSVTLEQNVPDIQEKQQEKKEKEEKSEENESQDIKEKKKNFKWTAKAGESGNAVLYITDDNEVKKIILDGRVVLVESDGEKRAFSIVADGKECIIKKDDEGHWTINGKKLEEFEEEDLKVLKLGELKDVVIKKDDIGYWIVKGDKLELVKDGKINIIKLDDGKKIIIDGKDAELKDKIARIIIPELSIKMDKLGHKNLALHLEGDQDKIKAVYVDPDMDVILDEEHIELIEKIGKLKKELKEIREQEGSEDKAEIKKQTLEELTQLLDEMNENLDKKAKKSENFYISVHPEHDVLYLTTIDELKEPGEESVIGFIREDDGFQIIFKSEKQDEEKRTKYEEIFDRVKNKLKGRYEVEREIKEEDKTFILKIKGERLNKAQKIDMKKLIQEIVEEIKEVRETEKEK